MHAKNGRKSARRRSVGSILIGWLMTWVMISRESLGVGLRACGMGDVPFVPIMTVGGEKLSDSAA